MLEQSIEDQSWRTPVLEDPRVATVFEIKQQFQNELDRFPATRSRADFMVNTLNRAWPHPQELVEVTGKVLSTVVELTMLEDEDTEPGEPAVESIGALLCENGQPEEVEYMVKEQPFRWQGFGLVDEPFMVGGEVIGKHYKIQLVLTRELNVALPMGAGEKLVLLRCSAESEKVSLSYSSNSMEYLELQVCDNFPELFEFLDVNILDTNSPAENIIALSGLTIKRTTEASDKSMDMLETYVSERVGAADERSPFVVGNLPETLIFSDEDPLRVVQIASQPGQFLAEVLDLRLVQVVDLNEHPDEDPEVSDSRYEFRLVFSTIAATKERDIARLQVRLRDIREIYSIREHFHAANNE